MKSTVKGGKEKEKKRKKRDTYILFYHTLFNTLKGG